MKTQIYFWIASREPQGAVHFHRDDDAKAMCGKILSTRANPVDISQTKWVDVCKECDRINDHGPIPRRFGVNLI